MEQLRRRRQHSKRQTAGALGALLCSACSLLHPAAAAPDDGAYADMICSPTSGCIEGKVATRAGVRLDVSTAPNSTLPGSALLLPGTYSSAAFASTGNNASLLQPFLTSSTTVKPNTGFLVSSASSSTANTLTIDQAPGLLIYSSSLFAGSSSLLSFNDSSVQNATSSFTPLSYILSKDIYVVANVPLSKGSRHARLVLWNSVADTNELSLDLAEGPWTISDIQSSKCTPACASGGVCTLSGQCTCSEGFVGATCNQCSPGRFGPSCAQCSVCEGGTCDEGIIGTGRCIPSKLTPAADACSCANGICSSSSTCTCNVGWSDVTGGKRCSTCATGFYMSGGGECLACGAGCTACAAGTGTCSTCASNLQFSQDDPRTCIAQRFLPGNGTSFSSCPTGTFLADAATQTCTPCNGACANCFGPNANQCLSCGTGRRLLDSSCVSVDAATGICDGSSASSANALAWILNVGTGVCDPLPPGCLAGNLPNFSSTSFDRTKIQCTKCLDGLVLNGNRCADSCPSGTFTSIAASGASCQACSSNCAQCEGSADYCTSCGAGQVAVDGVCTAGNSCPGGFFALNSTAPCSACHPDCKTCSITADKCLSCRADRPALLSSGTCVPTCALNEYLDDSSGSCTKCDSSCGTCSGPGSGKCMSCTGLSILKAGSCAPATCSTRTPYGVCLQDLAMAQSKSTLDAPVSPKKMPTWAYIVMSIGILMLLLLLLLLWRMRAVRKRLDRTKGFQVKRGLFSFLRRGRRDKSEPSDDVKHDSIHVHNNIELVRTPTPPSYHSATTLVGRPEYYKPPIASPSSSSVYSFPSGPESRLWPAEKTYRPDLSETSSNLSFVWPPVRPTAASHSLTSNNPFKPFIMRDSGSSYGSSSHHSSSLFNPEKRFGTVDYAAKQIELQERQKALSKLTGHESAV